MVYILVVVPSSAVTVTVIVLSPTSRSTSCAVVLVSASAGLYSTPAMSSDKVAATVTWAIAFSTSTV